MICRDPHHTLHAVADRLCVHADDLRLLIDEKSAGVSLEFTLDVVAALVHEYAIDPNWLLTGQYEGAKHRHALMLGEDRTRTGRQSIRDLVQLQYNRIGERRIYLSLPPTIEALRDKVASLLNPR